MSDRPDKCVLCDHPGSSHIPCDKWHVWAYRCPRCGEHYISELLVSQNESFFSNNRFKLACVAFEWRQQHVKTGSIPFVLTDEGKLSFSAYEAFPSCRIFQTDEMLAQFPKGADIIERAMLNLASMVDHPLQAVARDDNLPFAVFTRPADLKRMTDDLQEMGYIECGETWLRIKPKGWEKIDEWRRNPGPDVSRHAFVAMWFDASTQAVWKEAIEPAVTDAGFKPIRIDLKEHNNKICDEIIAEIRKSRFLVADFTGQRGGVYFEAGYAIGMGLPVIWQVRRGEPEPHFDTRQYNHIVYESEEDLRHRLYNRIMATIH